jgi:hypothetical protein
MMDTLPHDEIHRLCYSFGGLARQEEDNSRVDFSEPAIYPSFCAEGIWT